jgi:hypothetical protein
MSGDWGTPSGLGLLKSSSYRWRLEYVTLITRQWKLHSGASNIGTALDCLVDLAGCWERRYADIKAIFLFEPTDYDATGFLILCQRADRQARFGVPSRFDTTPSEPSASVCS